MTEVSKLVRARLAQGAVTGPHPDADQLTAFAERALTGREREQMLAHLASCAGCREVVALAAPEVEEGAVAAPAKPNWLPWPVLRWGAVAAAVVLVAAVVLLQSPRFAAPAGKTAQALPASQERALISSNKPKPAEAEQSPAASVVEADKSRAADERKADAVAGLGKRQNANAGAAKTGRATEPTEIAGGKVAMEHGLAGGPAQVMVARTEAPKDKKLAQPPEKEAGMAEKAAAEPAAEVASSGTMDTLAVAKPAAPPAPARAKSAAGASSDYAYSAPAYKDEETNVARADVQTRAQLKPASLRWTVTSDGRVQRSADAGHTWSDVVIARDVKFRALTSDGPEVWAGGNNAALFHSRDAGSSWRKVVIEDLRGDVIRLVINGRMLIISTSTGQMIEVSPGDLSEGPVKSPSSR